MAKKAKAKIEYTCKDCSHATDFHCKNWKGENFLCKCRFHEWSKFLNSSYCEHFQHK